MTAPAVIWPYEIVSQVAQSVGPCLMGAVFLWAGIGHIKNFHRTTQLLVARVPMPAMVLAVGTAVQILAGSCLIAGVERESAASALAFFTLIANVLLLDFWRKPPGEREHAQMAFLVNVAVIGGLIHIALA